jgi:VIT1/CCC1 family predicted Fe2+/Mn2+ transporter
MKASNSTNDLLARQQDEITEAKVYFSLAKLARGKNKQVLMEIGEDELKQYQILRQFTGKDAVPRRWVVLVYNLLAVIFGLTFAIKLLELDVKEDRLKKYMMAAGSIGLKELEDVEGKHEKELFKIVQEGRTSNIGAMTQGLCLSLLETIGALSGLTFSIGSSIIAGSSAFITGTAVFLSAATADYFSKSAEGKTKPVKDVIYSLVAYFIVLGLLILPYFLIDNAVNALIVTICIGLIVLVYYSIFYSVVSEKPFGATFFRMLIVMVVVFLISFNLGELARHIGG